MLMLKNTKQQPQKQLLRRVAPGIRSARAIRSVQVLRQKAKRAVLAIRTKVNITMTPTRITMITPDKSHAPLRARAASMSTTLASTGPAMKRRSLIVPSAYPLVVSLACQHRSNFPKSRKSVTRCCQRVTCTGPTFARIAASPISPITWATAGPPRIRRRDSVPRARPACRPAGLRVRRPARSPPRSGREPGPGSPRARCCTCCTPSRRRA